MNMWESLVWCVAYICVTAIVLRGLEYAGGKRKK